MVRIELTWNDELVLHCPFCGMAAVTAKGLETCEHTLFHASDHGFDYLHEKLGFTQADVEVSGKDFDSYTDDLDIPEAIKFPFYQPAPSFMGGYVGFARSL